ncbi:MAG TPA: Uma2 family endonuclease [Polyangium sp.]|jgi:Uma2 family endonuclease|nr:Uma2 family endonuclease [Polyangium sp.]
MVAVDPVGFGGPPRMTDKQWASLPEDEEGELVDGLLVEEEVPDWVHESVVSWLIRTLGNWADPRGGLVGGSELKYLLRPGRGRKPDVSMILPGRKWPAARRVLRHPPDVVIEVVSPSPRDARRDRIEKFAEYAVFGVHYYWIVEPATRLVEFYELNTQGKYVRVRGASAGIVDDIPGCEGLVFDLDDLWQRVEKFTSVDEGSEDTTPEEE